MKMEDGWISKKNLAKWLGVSGSTVLRMEKSGILPKAWRPTVGTTLFDFSKCKEYIKRHSTSASA